jgi:hypothetical protein
MLDIEATYHCPIHGMFSVICKDPPRYLECPDCYKPAMLHSCIAVHTGNDTASLLDAVRKLMDLRPPRPASPLTAGANGGTSAPKDPGTGLVMNEPEVEALALQMHEETERMKMATALAELSILA